MLFPTVKSMVKTNSNLNSNLIIFHLCVHSFTFVLCSFLDLAVERFPVSEREKEQNSNSIERSRGQSSKTQDHHNHNREVIFALPSLRLHFKSEHLQGASTPDGNSGNF